MTLTKTSQSPSASPSRRPQRGARRRAREFTLQAVYAWLIGGDNADIGVIDAHIRDTDGFQQADIDWYKTLVYGIAAEAPALREQFLPFIDRPLSELSPVEHAILLIGSYELTKHIEVPYRAVINEAVELAKGFGGTDGFKFVNGVLDRVAAQTRVLEVEAAARH